MGAGVDRLRRFNGVIATAFESGTNQVRHLLGDVRIDIELKKLCGQRINNSGTCRFVRNRSKTDTGDPRSGPQQQYADK